MEGSQSFENEWLQALEVIQKLGYEPEHFRFSVEAKDGQERVSKVLIASTVRSLSSIYYPTRSDWLGQLREDLTRGVFD